MDYDLLIIGGGPSGLSTAIAASKNGARVLCLDRKKTPGLPVQCAEGIGNFLLPFLPYRLPKKIFKMKIKGVHFWHDDFDVIRKGGYYEGATIDRIELETWLYEKAMKSGAKVLFSHDVVSFSKINGGYRVLSHNSGKSTFFYSKKIVLCDGANSKFLKSLGFPLTGTDLINVYSWQVDKLSLDEPEYEQVIFSNKFSSGYGYIFPKTESSANVGVGEVNTPFNALRNKFFTMINSNPFKRQFNSASFENEKSKSARFGGGPKSLKIGGISLCGDSANLNYKPLIEGILPAIISGNSAGEYLSTGNNTVSYKDYIESHLPNWKENIKLSNQMNKLFKEKNDNSLSLYALCSGMVSANSIVNFSKKSIKMQKLCLR